MDKIDYIKALIGYRLTQADIRTCREVKHVATNRAFAEMVKLEEIDSQDLFNRIHGCFEEASHSRPYHDWYHTCCVVECTILGLRYYLRTNLDELTETQVNSTIIAAAFHDVGHAGVREPDIVNVSRSIIIAHHFLEGLSIHDKGASSDAVDVPFMLETMQSTQYPFKREPLNECQATLRDADLLQILEPTWFDDIYCNMYQEFLEGNPTLDFKDFCMNEKSFITNAKFYSVWFREQMQKEFSDVALSRVDQVAVAVRN
jgi:hypothetical protein